MATTRASLPVPVRLMSLSWCHQLYSDAVPCRGLGDGRKNSEGACSVWGRECRTGSAPNVHLSLRHPLPNAPQGLGCTTASRQERQSMTCSRPTQPFVFGVCLVCPWAQSATSGFRCSRSVVPVTKSILVFRLMSLPTSLDRVLPRSRFLSSRYSFPF